MSTDRSTSGSRCAKTLRSGALVACALSAGCGTPAGPVAVERVAPAAGGDESARVASTPAMPRPARARGEVAARINAECERCHLAEAQQWRGSLHQRANVEPAYRRAFQLEPQPFCRSCHAPEADPMAAASETLSHLGVGCVSCHLEGDAVLATATPRSAERAPHALLREPRFGRADACAGCHEFPFPTARSRNDGDMMQTTVREHARSAEAGRSCAACHMPPDDRGRPSHAFVASRDPAQVRSAVDVAAVRIDAQRVRVTLTPRVAGHAFPTGDLFRRVEISVEAVGPDHMVLSQATRYLARHFAMRHGQVGRRLVRDDRVFSQPRTVELVLDEAAVGKRIAWRVAYQRVAHPVDEQAETAQVEGEVVLGWGWLPPAP
jgi:Cytochrome c554 and c-prime